MVGRRRVRGLTPWLLALLFAAILTPIVAADHLLIPRADYAEGAEALLTVRTSPFQPSAYSDSGGAIVIARGETLTAQQAEFVIDYARGTSSRMLMVFMALALLLLAWSVAIRQSRRGAYLRQQLLSLGLLTGLACLMKALLLLTSVSVLAAPVALTGLLVGRRSSQSAAISTAVLTALVIGALAPFDMGVILVLVVQAVGPSILLRRGSTLVQTIEAIILTALGSAIAFLALHYAAWGDLPPITDPLHSTWFAALTGALSAGIAASLLRPAYDYFGGDVSARTLNRLGQHSQPILRQLAERSPRTWKSSLDMANLALAAGPCVDADLQLLRNGAYYHDLGKSANPQHFEDDSDNELSLIESRDAEFAHVTEGIRIAQGAGLPERVIDFVRSHHGAGLADALWTKAKSEPQLSIKEFQYPGVRPQCPETGILCICESVEEQAGRLGPLTKVEAAKVVTQVIFGKLQAGQLDDSGLSIDSLNKISDALKDALFAARAEAKPVTRASAVEIPPAIVETEEPPPPPPARAKLKPEPEAKISQRITAARDIDAQPTTERPVVSPKRPISALTVMGVPARQFTVEEMTTSSDEADVDLPITIPMVKPNKLAAWTDALDEARVRPGIRALAPPIHSAPSALLGKKRDTIPLGNQDADDSNSSIRRGERASSQDGMQPGEMVLGAPPGTHPERTNGRAEETTALRPLPVPNEARRPEDRITEEQLALLPPEAFPETEPDTTRPSTDDADDES